MGAEGRGVVALHPADDVVLNSVLQLPSGFAHVSTATVAFDGVYNVRFLVLRQRVFLTRAED